MSTQVIDTFLTWIKFKSDTRGIESADKGMDKLQKRTEKVDSVMRTLNHTLGLIGATFAVDKIVELNNEYDISQNKLKSVNLAGKELIDVTAKILAISNATGTSIHANSELFQQLSVSLGDAADNAEKLKVMDTLSKIFAINGTEANQSKNAINDMTKALEGPTVIYREIKQSMADIPALLAVVSKHFKSMGTTTSEALQGNGFATKDFIKILTDANIDVTKQFALTSRTIPQSFKAISNSLSSFFGQLGITSGLVSSLTGKLDTFAKTLTSMSQWISMNSDMIMSFANALGLFLSIVAIKFAVMGATALVTFLPMIVAISSLILIIQDLYLFLSGGNSVFADFLSWIGLSDDSIENIKININRFIQSIKDMIKILLSSKIAIGALSAALGVLATRWLAIKVYGFGMALLSILSSIYAFATAIGVVSVAQGIFNVALGVMEALLSPIILVVIAVIAAISGLTYIIYEFGAAVKDAIVNTAVNGFKLFESYIKIFYNSVKSTFSNLGNVLSSPFIKLKGYIDAVIDRLNIVKKFKSGLSSVKSFLGFGDDAKESKNKNNNSIGGISSNIKPQINPLSDGINRAKISQSSASYAASSSSKTSNSQTHNNVFNIDIKPQAGASAAETGQQFANEFQSILSNTFRNTVLNSDSAIKR